MTSREWLAVERKPDLQGMVGGETETGGDTETMTYGEWLEEERKP